jgi:acetyltransferase-like isoleucine patch superfamily enzyme
MNDHKIYQGVDIGSQASIGRFVIIGEPPRGKREDETNTKIGDNCTIRSHSIIYSGNSIGRDFQTGHGVTIRENNTIGNNVSIGTNSVIERDSRIGNNVRLHSNVFVPEYTEIRDNAWIGPNVVLTNTPHPLCPKAKECMKGPVIGKGAKIGANSTILPFVKIGENALVGSGSLVVGDVPDKAVVAGNPARIIKNIDDLKCRFEYIEKPY